MCIFIYVLPTCIYAHTLLFSRSVPYLCQVPLSRDFPRQEYWSWLPFPSLGGSSSPRDGICVSSNADGSFTTEPPGKPIYVHLCCAVLRRFFSCVWLCDPMDCSPPGCSVHGILQARITWVGCHGLRQGMFLTQGSKRCLLHFLHQRAGSLPLAPRPNPTCTYKYVQFPFSIFKKVYLFEGLWLRR